MRYMPAILICLVLGHAASAEETTMQLMARIPMPGVTGRIDRNCSRTRIRACTGFMFAGWALLDSHHRQCSIHTLYSAGRKR
jgi:hypothetical protein